MSKQPPRKKLKGHYADARYAAILLGRASGHTVMAQDTAFECPLCGASGSLYREDAPDFWVRGSILQPCPR